MSTADINQQKNSTTLTNRVFRFLVENAYAFTVGVMCFVHAVLLAVMLFTGVMPLFYFNILSVVVYIFCFILCRLGHIKPVYVSVILEVTVYTVISTFYIGLRCGTYCFLFSIVPIIIYFGSSFVKGSNRWSIAVMLGLNFAVFVALYVRFAGVEPVYDLDPGVKLFLVIFSSFAMIFSTIFYNALYIYISENALSILQMENKQLNTDAREDALTSLLNRRGFLPLVEDLMKGDSGEAFCIAFCDLDNFKTVNDSYGHEAGDDVLKHVTMLIRRQLPENDICRWGGEEIVILLKGLNLDSAKVVMENVRKAVETTPTIFFNKQIFITVTIGLAQNDASYDSPEQIIKVADDRMYYGKQHGKNVLISKDN